VGDRSPRFEPDVDSRAGLFQQPSLQALRSELIFRSANDHGARPAVANQPKSILAGRG
jgi:hypothetical protein